MLELDAAVASRRVGLRLRVAEGETVAILGPNGAGKSTVLGLVAGLVRPTEGAVRIDRRTVAAASAGGMATWVPPHGRGAALLAQEALLFPHLTAEENVAFAPRARGLGRRRAAEAARRWLGEVEAVDLARRRPAELSGGQAQRVAVARALAAEPRLLLLDEPMAALDASAAPELRRTLRRVLADRTALLVTHEVLDAYLLADRVVVLDGGRVADAGPTRAVLDRPRTPFVASLAGVNLLTGVLRAGALRTPDGVALRGRLVDGAAALPEGAAVGIALHPAAVSVGPADPGAGNRIRTRAVDLEPVGGLVRVRTEALVADVPPAVAAALDPAPGTPVWCAFRPEDTRIHPLDRSGGAAEEAPPSS